MRRDDLYRTEFLIVLMLFILGEWVLNINVYLSSGMQLLSCLLVTVALAYSIFYLAFYKKFVGLVHGRLPHAMLVLMFSLFVALIVVPRVMNMSLVWLLALILLYSSAYFVILIPLYIITEFSWYAFSKNKKAIGYLLVVLALIISVIYTTMVLKNYPVDDEELMAFYSIKDLLGGTNPYALSISSLLYSKTITTMIAFTTNNTVLGVVTYPALYWLSGLPFYLLIRPNAYNLGQTLLPAEAGVFIFFLIVVTTYAFKEKRRSGFSLAILAFLSLALGITPSITAYLMLTLIIFAYLKIESRYAFILLGLSLSLQEELWLPVMFLLIYSFNNYGLRKGTKDFVGAAAVFLLINAYFIALNPQDFFNAVFTPLNSRMLPSGGSPFGIFILLRYHVLMGLFPELFYILILILVVVFAYLNKKELVPLFSFIPFLFLARSLSAYYAFFTFMLVVAIYTSKHQQRIGRISAYLKKNATIVYAVVILLVIAAGIVTYASHVAYTRGFNIRVSEQSITLSGNKTTYTANLSYNGLSNSTVYFLLVGYSGSAVNFYGLANQTIVNGTVKPACNAYPCTVNTNELILNSSAYFRKIVAQVEYPQGNPISYVAAVIYNGEYFYVSDSIHSSN